ncbi:hypothetical protein JOF56_000047 [Kibdelosporangium banguiense]|uniref:Uncharacterized protein n=1 Tax=Kibdelosporangium banguiense TaxID=1365924 RepID=A0ABS4T5C1_9PSEU|nr:hypothetical protein [Kibdelosporangium banguiense]MBP2319662.1 hypothetical protein [Kibdelosporangium banguiense]
MANALTRTIRSVLRRLLRRRVPAGAGRGRPGETGGSAGVREPRRPKPNGPRSAAGAKPDPQEGQTITLEDPRR